jgi:hypothetical protein
MPRVKSAVRFLLPRVLKSLLFLRLTLLRNREAAGEAEAILTVQRANADALRMLNEAAPTDRIIQLKSLEAFAKAADGKATKIIIPSELQSIAGNVAAIKEIWKDEPTK